MIASQLFEGISVSRIPDLDFTGIASDSRRIRPGDLFVAIRGSRFDGHNFIRDALNRGARGVLAEHEVYGFEDLILTPSTRAAESMLWYNFTGRPTDGMTKVAVTGTAGKTSCAFILRHLLRSEGRKVGAITTVRTMAGDETIDLGNNGGSSVSDIPGAMTTPDPEYFFGAAKQMKDAGCDTIIYEASSQALAMEKLTAIQPDLALFTNLSPEHLDYHHEMEQYFHSKASLMKGAGCAVINADDEWMKKLPEMYPDVPVIRCSVCDNTMDVRGTGIRQHSGHVHYTYLSRNAVMQMDAPIPGIYSVYNTMMCAAAALKLGMDPVTVRDALSSFGGVEGRLDRIRFPGSAAGVLPAVYIDYAHTPDSLRAALTALRAEVCGHLTVVFGCGGERDRSKRPLMAKTAQELADLTVITGDNPRGENPGAIIADILAGVNEAAPVKVIPDRREAIRWAVLNAESGDTILLAGKGHEKYEITAEGKFPFDEETIVREAADERLREL